MKNLIFLLLISAARLYDAQGNLQFNQVYNFSGKLTNAYPSTGTNNLGYVAGISPLTVPASKVWRIERIWIHGAVNQTVFINNLCIDQAMNGAFTNITTPIWMKSGDVLRLGGNTDQLYSINVVEFNVIP